MSTVSATTKEKLLKELQFNPELDFDVEYPRTSLVKKEIIENYGFEGIELLFQNYGFYHSPILPDKKHEKIFLLNDADDSCPWKKYAHEDASVIIDDIFKDISQHLPNFLPEFKKKCKYVFAIKWSKKSWALGYFLEQKEAPYYKVFIGNPPNENVENLKPSLKELKWEIPKVLKEFYAIHDGFGLFSHLDDLILPLDWLQDMKYSIDNDIRAHFAKIILDKEATEIFEKELQENPLGFNPENLLCFFRYTYYIKKTQKRMVGKQCFHRKNNIESSSMTVFCDDATLNTNDKELINKNKKWKLSETEQTFYEFIDDRFWKIINSEEA